ncbi:MAG: tetratricopeptide repeat protein [Methanosarcinales archaeon]|nr:tetratricopeptide repeat protein [Methanosarcinales archaeon]
MKNIDKMVTVMVAVTSLLLGIYNTWAIQNPPDSTDLVAKGNNYFDQGDYKKAINCYEKALKLHGSYSNALKYKGYALFNLGLNNQSLGIKLNSASVYDSPAIYATTLIEHYNSSSYVLDDSSRSYLESAYQYLQDAARSNPTDVEALLYSGILSLYLLPSPSYDPVKEFDKTLRTAEELSYKRSLHIRAVKSAAWTGKGVAYLNMGETRKAESCFRSARQALEMQSD